jgi:hypothetical protein
MNIVDYHAFDAFKVLSSSFARKSDPIVDDDDHHHLAMNLINTTNALDVKGVFILFCKKEI